MTAIVTPYLSMDVHKLFLPWFLILMIRPLTIFKQRMIVDVCILSNRITLQEMFIFFIIIQKRKIGIQIV